MTAAFAAAPLLIALAGTPASVGTGIQAGPVCLPVTAQPGGTYALPPVTVQNTGSGSESIGLTVQKLPASWVTFGPPVSLASGAKAQVTARLTVPSSVRPGPYVAWVVAGIAGNGTPGQANLGAEAIANLEFTVTGPGVSRHVTCVTPGAGNSGAGVTVGAPAASVTPPWPSGKTMWLIFAGVMAALGLRMIFGRRAA